MRKKNLLKPNLSVHRVTDIDLAALAGKGIRGFLLDLDNTLTVWHGMQVDAAVLDWLAKGKNQGLCFCVLSNSHAARVQPMEELLGIPVLYLSASCTIGTNKPYSDFIKVPTFFIKHCTCFIKTDADILKV